MNIKMILILIFGLILIGCSDSSNPLEYPKKDDYCLEFDGIDDVLLIKDNNSKLDSIFNAITIECWIKINNKVINYCRIIDRSDNHNNDRYILGLSDGGNKAHFNVNGISVSSIQRINFEVWNHIVGVYSENKIKLYLNGIFQGEKDCFTNFNVAESDTFIGNNDLGNRQFTGLIDDIRIWNLERSEEEIKENMNSLLDYNTSGLVLYYPMLEKTNQIVIDKVSENNAFLGLSENEEHSDPKWIKIDPR